METEIDFMFSFVWSNVSKSHFKIFNVFSNRNGAILGLIFLKHNIFKNILKSQHLPDCMNSLPGFLKIFDDLHLVLDAYPVFKL